MVLVLLNLLVHAGNILYLLSYTVRDILWLRILAIIAGCCLIPYYYFMPEPLWEPLAWNAVFVLINFAQSLVLVAERRPANLNEDEIKLYNLAFRNLKIHEFKKLLKHGTWEEAKPNDIVTKEGESIDHIKVVFDGELIVRKQGRDIAHLRPGHFVGEMSFLTGDKSSAEIVAVTKSKFMSWEFERLKKDLLNQQQLQMAFQYILSEDLIKKIKAS